MKNLWLCWWLIVSVVSVRGWTDRFGRVCEFRSYFPDDSNGSYNCTFPFTFQGKTFDECVSGDSTFLPKDYDLEGGTSSDMWCAMVGEYSNTSSRVWGLWGFCDCAFPPTSNPTGTPTVSEAPTGSPSFVPTNLPTGSPVTRSPTLPGETFSPTGAPSRFPTASPTDTPVPSESPTTSPTELPTISPSAAPSGHPTTADPTISPSEAPTGSPTTESPSKSPSSAPSSSPTNPTVEPTSSPTSSPTKPSTEGGIIFTSWMIGAVVAGGVILIFACCVTYRVACKKRYTYDSSVLPTKEQKMNVLRQNFLNSPHSNQTKSIVRRTQSPKPPKRPSADFVLREGVLHALEGSSSVVTLSKTRWKKIYLVLLKDGALLCYSSMVQSNEGHKTYCGGLWSFASGSVDDVELTSKKRDGKIYFSFSISTCWKDKLYFGSTDRKDARAWVANIKSTIRPSLMNPRGRMNRHASIHSYHDGDDDVVSNGTEDDEDMVTLAMA